MKRMAIKQGVFSKLWKGRSGQGALPGAGERYDLEQKKTLGNFIIFLGIVLVVIDYWWYGQTFSGFIFPFPSWTWVFSSGGIFDVWFNTISFGLFLVFVIFFSIKKISDRNYNPQEMIAFGIFAFLLSFILGTNAWSYDPRSLLHIIFILIFGLTYLGRQGDKTEAYIIMSALIIIDFFMYGLLKQFTFFAILPFLPFFMIFYTSIRNPTGFNLMVLLVLFSFMAFMVVGETGVRGTMFLPAQEGVHKFEALEKIKTTFTNIQTNIKQSTARQLEYATGGYYQGKVEENQQEPIGVYLENIKSSQTEFFEGEPVSVWGTLRAQTLDDPINVSLSCYASDEFTTQSTGDATDPDKKILGTILPSNLRNNYLVETLELNDFTCLFDNGLEGGQQTIVLQADFSFETDAYLRTYFIDLDRRRQLVRNNIDPIEEFGIRERDPVAVYTNGPVKIGAETTKNLPIGVQAQAVDGEETVVRLGVTIENQWQGTIKQLKELFISVPAGTELLNCGSDLFERIPERDLDGNLIYSINVAGSDRFKNIHDFKSVNCLIRVRDSSEVLGSTPIATRYYNIEAAYDYILRSPVSVSIKKQVGSLASDTFSSNSGIKSFTVQHDGQDITLSWVAGLLKGRKIRGYQIAIDSQLITENNWGGAEAIQVFMLSEEELGREEVQKSATLDRKLSSGDCGSELYVAIRAYGGDTGIEERGGVVTTSPLRISQEDGICQ